jgi:hypothetical protein
MNHNYCRVGTDRERSENVRVGALDLKSYHMAQGSRSANPRIFGSDDLGGEDPPLSWL